MPYELGVIPSTVGEHAHMLPHTVDTTDCNCRYSETKTEHYLVSAYGVQGFNCLATQTLENQNIYYDIQVPTLS